MSSALRFTKLIGQNVANTNTSSGALLLNSVKALGSLYSSQVAGIVSVQNQDESFVRLPPFDYNSKRYTKVHKYFPFLDPTHVRMNENSQIVTVEGNIGSGKDAFAKDIAKLFGWHYMPEPKIEDLYINDDGFDYRSLNQYIGEKTHAIDEKMYYENPKHLAVPWLKVLFYRIRFAQYVDALAHLFNTGEGAVLERSPGSDFVFADAMYKAGYFPKDAYDYYYRLRYNTIHKLLRPHLIIYLDTDVDIALKRIKQRNIPHEVNSKVLNSDYLKTIESSYKEKYLPDASRYSELLTFKWNEPLPHEEIVRAIEALPMVAEPLDMEKFKDWDFDELPNVHENRWVYTNKKAEFLDEFDNTPLYDVDSLCFSNHDGEHRDNVYESLVPNYGISPNFGDKANIIKKILGIYNFKKEQDFLCRDPFY